MSYSVTRFRELACPVCFALAGEKCTRPTNIGRREVGWVHVARADAYYGFP